MLLILNKYFAAELLSKQSKAQNCKISCFSSKCKPAIQKLIFRYNTDKMATLKHDENC